MMDEDALVDVSVYKKRQKGGGVVLDLTEEPFVRVFVPPSTTVQELKQKVFATAKKEGSVPPEVKSLKLYVQLASQQQLDGILDEGGGGGATKTTARTASALNVSPKGKFEELKTSDQKIGEFANDDGQVLELAVFMMDKTWVQTMLDIVMFVVYMGLNIGINLYNKWMFSVLNFRIPLFNLVVHQFAIFFVLLAFVLLYMCTGWGLKIIRVDCFKNKGRDFGLISALGIVGALNFGLTSVALMLLSQADLQIVRATIPFFVAVSFAILEGLKFSGVEIFFMLVTIVGVVIVVVFHSTTWHMDVTGLIIAVASNFAAAVHMSLYALCNSFLKLDAWSTLFYTVVPLGAFVIPFVFITHEPANIEAFLKSGHSVIEVVRVRASRAREHASVAPGESVKCSAVQAVQGRARWLCCFACRCLAFGDHHKTRSACECVCVCVSCRDSSVCVCVCVFMCFARSWGHSSHTHEHTHTHARTHAHTGVGGGHGAGDAVQLDPHRVHPAHDVGVRGGGRQLQDRDPHHPVGGVRAGHPPAALVHRRHRHRRALLPRKLRREGGAAPRQGRYAYACIHSKQQQQQQQQQQHFLLPTLLLML